MIKLLYIGLVEPRLIKDITNTVIINKVIIKKAKNKELYVDVVGKNNKIIAWTETYKSIQGAKNAAKALKKVIKNAVVIDKSK